MAHLDYDVYLCSVPPGNPVATAVATGLQQRGFRVCLPVAGGNFLPEPERLASIERSADFVVVSAGPSSPDDDIARRREIERDIGHALATSRHVLWIAEQPETAPRPLPPSPNLAHLKSWQYVPYDPARGREAVAILSHRLLSSQDVEDRQLMRRAKQATMGVALILLMVLAGLAIPPLVRAWNRPKPLPPLPPFELHWAGFAQRADPEGGRWSAFRLTDGVVVRPLDQWRLVFTPGSDGYAFVVATDVGGGVRVLFPDVALRGLSRVRAGHSYAVPARGSWFDVSPEAGLAGVFVIGSHDSLENLEELTEEPDGEGNPKARLELLALTLDGLLDGRRTTARTQAVTRKGQVIRRSLGGVRVAATASVTLADGTSVEYPVSSERGLLSAAVEIRVRFER